MSSENRYISHCYLRTQTVKTVRDSSTPLGMTKLRTSSAQKSKHHFEDEIFQSVMLSEGEASLTISERLIDRK